MKAWNDLEKEKSLYWTGDRDNPKSFWWLDHGIKIEKFPNGKIDIKNSMNNGEYYSEISSNQRYVFEHEGWLPGCYKVCMDTFTDRINKVDELLRRYPNDCELQNRKNNLKIKLDSYIDMYKNLVNS